MFVLMPLAGHTLLASTTALLLKFRYFIILPQDLLGSYQSQSIAQTWLSLQRLSMAAFIALSAVGIIQYIM